MATSIFRTSEENLQLRIVEALTCVVDFRLYNLADYDRAVLSIAQSTHANFVAQAV